MKCYEGNGIAYCPECKSFFRWSDVGYEDYPATRYDPPERVEYCPCCGSDEGGIESAHECKYCEEGYLYGSELDDMCQSCFDKSVKKLTKFVELNGDEKDSAVLSFLLDY